MRPGAHPDVLFVITDLRVGGSERQLALLASTLATEGMTVTVYSFLDGSVRAELERAGVEVTLAPGTGRLFVGSNTAGFPLIAWHLLWFMLRRRPRIVHFVLPAAYLLGAPLAVIARVPIRIMSRRSLNTYQRNGLIRAVERRWHTFMHALLGNSLSVVHELRDHEGVPASKLGLIYNGLDMSRFAQIEPRDQARAGLGLSPDDFVMVTVANLIPYKGHADLFAALGRARSGLPQNWRLLVVGRDDGIGPELKRLRAELGLDDYVDFLGTRNDIARLLAAADVGLLCSHEEGFSNALLEGMAAGLPMIATDVGGNAEAIIDQENGLIVPAKDPARLADAVLHLANDPPLRARLGAAARARVAEKFSLERCVDGYDALYRALLAGLSVNDVEQLRITAR